MTMKKISTTTKTMMKKDTTTKTIQKNNHQKRKGTDDCKYLLRLLGSKAVDFSDFYSLNKHFKLKHQSYQVRYLISFNLYKQTYDKVSCFQI